MTGHAVFTNACHCHTGTTWISSASSRTRAPLGASRERIARKPLDHRIQQQEISVSLACRDDLEFINKQVDKGAIARLEHVAATPFKRLTYTEAVEILEGVVRDKKKKFEFPVHFLLYAPRWLPASRQSTALCCGPGTADLNASRMPASCQMTAKPAVASGQYTQLCTWHPPAGPMA